EQIQSVAGGARRDGAACGTQVCGTGRRRRGCTSRNGVTVRSSRPRGVLRGVLGTTATCALVLLAGCSSTEPGTPEAGASPRETAEPNHTATTAPESPTPTPEGKTIHDVDP